MISIEVALLRLGLAIVLGAIVGFEREWQLKNAGLKTNTLVALGAAAFAMVSDTFGGDNHNPGMIAAAVVGGIGFIGAGVIMHRGATVEGVTTAATLWSTASTGVVAGLGHFAAATILAVAILLIQIVFRPIERNLVRKRRRTRGTELDLHVDCDARTLRALNEEWTRHAASEGFDAVRRSVVRDEQDVVKWRVVFRTKTPADLTRLEETLVALEGVRRVDVQRLGIEED